MHFSWLIQDVASFYNFITFWNQQISLHLIEAPADEVNPVNLSDNSVKE